MYHCFNISKPQMLYILLNSLFFSNFSCCIIQVTRWHNEWPLTQLNCIIFNFSLWTNLNTLVFIFSKILTTENLCIWNWMWASLQIIGQANSWFCMAKPTQHCLFSDYTESSSRLRKSFTQKCLWNCYNHSLYFYWLVQDWKYGYIHFCLSNVTLSSNRHYITFIPQKKIYIWKRSLLFWDNLQNFILI